MTIFKRKIAKKYIALFVLLCILVLTFFLRGKKEVETIVVARVDLVQEVSATGKTKARNEADLSFDKSGKVARIFVEVGDPVQKGALLAELDIQSDLASLSKERSLLLEAESDYKEASKNTTLSIMDAYSSADNAIRNKVDQFFKQPRDNPRFEVKFSDGNYTHYFDVPSSVVLELNNERKSIETMLNDWQKELPKINYDNASDFSDIAVSRMNKVSLFLDRVAYAINSFAPAEFAYESTVSGYKTSIDSARSSVATAKEKISSVSGKFSKISQIKSSIASLEANLSKSRIVAPLSGIVSIQEAKLGQVTQLGEVLISIISNNDMFIETNVSEINIAKVGVGDKVKVEFDALPNEVFDGNVSFIDPAETIVDGVANYKVRVELASLDSRIRSGLTANIKIETETKQNVLAIPIFVISKENGKSFVSKIVEDQNLKTEIKTGLLGSGGRVEVLEGLIEGDVISSDF